MPARRSRSVRPATLPGEDVRGEYAYRRLAGAADDNLSRLGLRPVFLAPAQRQGLQVEPQARVPDLPGAGIEPADQAEEAPARAARAAGGARCNQRGLVHGLHARPAERRT